MPKVSVIVPCYNVAPYICACLDSLVNQTLHDIEIICVDDKSTDNTLEIIQKRATQDKRIKVIAQPANSGVSVARNTGIDAATGEYIGFVDPDDYVDLDFYEKLYAVATQEKADIAKAGMTVVNTDGVQSVSRLWRQVKQNKLNFQREFTSAIYKKEFLDKCELRFLPRISIGEDINWLIKVAYLANKIAVINSVNYMYIRREDSAYTQMLTRDKLEKVCAASQDLLIWTNSQPDMTFSDYMNIMRPVYELLLGNLPRATTLQDKELIVRHIIDVFKNTKHKKEALKQNVKSYARLPLVRGQVGEIIKALTYQKKRYYLFGLVPIVKILHLPKQEYKIILFDFFPVFRCVRERWKDNFYICGIKILKIAH
jgi:glycosyltransferase involved in cell wall biosynthesis